MQAVPKHLCNQATSFQYPPPLCFWNSFGTLLHFFTGVCVFVCSDLTLQRCFVVGNVGTEKWKCWNKTFFSWFPNFPLIKKKMFLDVVQKLYVWSLQNFIEFYSRGGEMPCKAGALIRFSLFKPENQVNLLPLLTSTLLATSWKGWRWQLGKVQ